MLKKLLLSASFVFMALAATAVEVPLYEGTGNLNEGYFNISRKELTALAAGTVITIDYTLNEGVTDAKLRLSASYGNNLLPGFAPVDETGFMHVTESGSYNYTLTQEVITKLDDKDFHGWDNSVRVSGEGMTVTKVYYTLNDTEQLISTPANLNDYGWKGLLFSKDVITKAKAGWKIVMDYTVNDGAENAYFRWATSYANTQLPGFEGTSQLGDKSVIPVTTDGSYTYIITEDAVAKLNDTDVTGWDKDIHIVGSGITVTKLELVRAAGGSTTGIQSIAPDFTNVPVRYYTLQGMEVMNPGRGVYIRVQGNKSSKIFIK